MGHCHGDVHNRWNHGGNNQQHLHDNNGGNKIQNSDIRFVNIDRY